MASYVPALRGEIGDWTYYVTVMKLAEVATGVKFADELHASTELDELIQREIGKRVEREMVPYLIDQKQRFYGALIVAVYGGHPEFNPVSVSGEHRLIDDSNRSSYGFGLLRFDGSQQYFALDGQHRLKSIQLALKQSKELGNESISVIMVAHEDTPEGLSRTRRLFSTLNRHAEKTKVGLNIAIDEDDPTAIVTRRLVREHPYLGILKLIKADKDGLGQKQLGPTPANAGYLTTLAALYECNEMLMQAYDGGKDIDAKFRADRPDDSTLDEYYNYISDLWTSLIDSAPDLRAVRTGRQKPGALRPDKKSGGGGSVLARPMGHLIICEVMREALIRGEDATTFLPRLLSEVSYDLDASPWINVIWNPASRNIKGGKKERTLVVRLLLHKFGLLPNSVKVGELRETYRQITGDKAIKLLSLSETGQQNEDKSPSDDPLENQQIENT